MKDTSRLILTYTMEVSLPEPLQKMPRADLARIVDGLLGDVVHQGLKAVATKRLQGSGIMIHKMQHHVDVERPRREPGQTIPKELLVRAAPHLTDEELAELEARVGNVPFLAEEELEKRLRTQALKLCNDVRLAPVVVRGVRPNDEPLETEAQLNFTHGSVFFDRVAAQPAAEGERTRGGPAAGRRNARSRPLSRNHLGWTGSGSSPPPARALSRLPARRLAGRTRLSLFCRVGAGGLALRGMLHFTVPLW